MKNDWSSEYKLYCFANNRKPADQMAHDEIVLPGGMMVNFINFMNQMNHKYRIAAGLERNEPMNYRERNWFISNFIKNHSTELR